MHDKKKGSIGTSKARILNSTNSIIGFPCGFFSEYRQLLCDGISLLNNGKQLMARKKRTLCVLLESEVPYA